MLTWFQEIMWPRGGEFFFFVMHLSKLLTSSYGQREVCSRCVCLCVSVMCILKNEILVLSNFQKNCKKFPCFPSFLHLFLLFLSSTVSCAKAFQSTRCNSVDINMKHKKRKSWVCVSRAINIIFWNGPRLDESLVKMFGSQRSLRFLNFSWSG